MWRAFRQALGLLDAGERRRAYAVMGLSAAAGIVQTLAIVSVMPFIALLATPDLMTSSSVLARLANLVGAETWRGFLLWFGVLGVGVLTLGNLFLALEHRFSARFLSLLSHRMFSLVLTNMLRQPYEYFVENNSARLSDVVLSQVRRVTEGVIGECIVVVSNVVMAASIVAMLLIVSWQTTLVTLVLLVVLYLFVFLLLRGRIARHGATLTTLSGDTFAAVSDTFEGIAEIKVRQAEDYFARRFERPSRRIAELAFRYSVLGYLPHLLLESLIFAGLVGMALYFTLSTQSPGVILSLLALYGLAAYRLVPSLKSVFAGIAEIQHNAAAVDMVLRHSRAQSPVPAAGAIPAPAGAIRLESVSYRTAADQKVLLHEIDLTIPAGSSVCLFGPSGSGKTTLLNLLSGLLEASSGTICCDDTPLTAATRASWQRQVGYCPQRVFLFDDTLARNIAFGVPSADIDERRLDAVAALARLAEFVSGRSADRYQAPIRAQGKNLSGGQGQRIGIARALYHDPAVLLFDESFNGLDVANRDAILDGLLGLESKTVVFASHDPAVAARCDQVIELGEGRIVGMLPGGGARLRPGAVG